MLNDTHLPQSEVDGTAADSTNENPREASALAPRFSRLALCVTAVGALTLGVVGTVAYGVWFNHDQQAYAEAIANARQSLGMPVAADSLPVRQLVSTSAATSTVQTAAPEAALVSADGGTQEQSVQPDQAVQAVQTNRDQAVWSGQIAQAPAAVMSPAGLATPANNPIDTQAIAPAASAAPASTTPPPHSGRRASGSPGSGSAQGAASRSARGGQQERRLAAENARQSGRPGAPQYARRQTGRSSLFARIGSFFRRVNYRQQGGANQPAQQQQQAIYSHP
jgi:hypothetical protein